MHKFMLVFSLMLMLAACNSNVGVEADCDEDTVGGNTDEPETTGCAASTYGWGEDEVLFVCANTLPLIQASVFSRTQVVSVSFVNYRSAWNHIGEICIQSVGNTPLENIESLQFDVSDWTLPPVVLDRPWSADGKICAEVPITVGASSYQTLTVSMLLDTATGGNAEYQFEITSDTDITLDDDESQPIVGEFPIRSEVVEVISN